MILKMGEDQTYDPDDVTPIHPDHPDSTDDNTTGDDTDKNTDGN